MSDQSFDFEKFVNDIDIREEKRNNDRSTNRDIIEHDILRRKRADLYREKWQNRIKWEK